MRPKLKSLLARVCLVGGVALVSTLFARNAPHDQSIAIRFGSRAVTHVDGVVTKTGDSEPTAGFSQDFPGGSPRFVRHAFSATNGTYIVVIMFKERSDPTLAGAAAPATNHEHRAAGEHDPIRAETSFQRQVSLVGGEVIVSPD